MFDRAIAKIENYMDECLSDLDINWPIEDFQQRSYARWAAIEILNALMDHPFEPVTDVIEEFQVKMEAFACLAKDMDVSVMFSVAYDTAEDIGSLFV